MAVKEKIRIRIKGYDHQLVDQSAEKIVETARRTGARVSGPVPLPTEEHGFQIDPGGGAPPPTPPAPGRGGPPPPTPPPRGD